MFSDLKLPDPSSLSSSPREGSLVVLEALKDIIDVKYLNRIVAIITTTTAFNENKEKVAGYAFYLSFLSKNDFSYRLFEVMCKKPDGGYPVQVNAFSGPVKPFGEANSEAELEGILKKVLEEDRTRFIIVNNY